MSNDVDAPPIQRRGLMLVLSSPSGAGKTTLSRQLLENDSHIQLSVSCTTRGKRPGETDGVDYNFIDAATFRSMIDRGEFWSMRVYSTTITVRPVRPSKPPSARAATCCSTSTGRARSS